MRPSPEVDSKLGVPDNIDRCPGISHWAKKPVPETAVREGSGEGDRYADERCRCRIRDESDERLLQPQRPRTPYRVDLGLHDERDAQEDCARHSHLMRRHVKVLPEAKSGQETAVEKP